MAGNAPRVELWEQSRNGTPLAKFWCADLPDGTMFAVPEHYGEEAAQQAYELVRAEKAKQIQ